MSSRQALVPTELPIREAFSIYMRRLAVFASIALISLLIGLSIFSFQIFGPWIGVLLLVVTISITIAVAILFVALDAKKKHQPMLQIPESYDFDESRIFAPLDALSDEITDTKQRAGVLLVSEVSGNPFYPITVGTPKELLPLYDRPIIYYQISLMMSAGIRDIWFTGSVSSVEAIEQLIGTGEQWGVRFNYAGFGHPRTIGLALQRIVHLIGERPTMISLGDMVLGERLIPPAIGKALKTPSAAHIFAFRINPEVRRLLANSWKDVDDIPPPFVQYDLMTLRGRISVPGLYLFDEALSENIDLAERGTDKAIGITDILHIYLKQERLNVSMLSEVNLLPIGTPSSLAKSSEYLEQLERDQDRKMPTPEEIALQAGFIDMRQFQTILENIKPSPYRQHLERFLGFRIYGAEGAPTGP